MIIIRKFLDKINKICNDINFNCTDIIDHSILKNIDNLQYYDLLEFWCHYKYNNINHEDNYYSWIGDPDNIYEIEIGIFTIFPNTILEDDFDYLYCLYQNPNIVTYDYNIMRKNKKSLHIDFYSFYYKNIFKKVNNDCVINIINYI